jgi:hypothetical protein
LVKENLPIASRLHESTKQPFQTYSEPITDHGFLCYLDNSGVNLRLVNLTVKWEAHGFQKNVFPYLEINKEHFCNLSSWGGGDQEDQSSSPAG